MGDEPDVVDGVAVEAAGEVVVDAAVGHVSEAEGEVSLGVVAVGSVVVEGVLEE